MPITLTRFATTNTPRIITTKTAINAQKTYILDVYRYILNLLCFFASKILHLTSDIFEQFTYKIKLMKNFKVIALAAFLAVGTIAMAQGPNGGRQMPSATERAKTTVEALKTSLTLTADQATKILAVSLKYAAKDSVSSVAMRAQGQDFDREAFMAERTKTREAQTAEIKAILTDAQKTKYDEVLATSRQGGFGGGAPRN